jgi:hypothetical protein
MPWQRPIADSATEDRFDATAEIPPKLFPQPLNVRIHCACPAFGRIAQELHQYLSGHNLSGVLHQ